MTRSYFIPFNRNTGSKRELAVRTDYIFTLRIGYLRYAAETEFLFLVTATFDFDLHDRKINSILPVLMGRPHTKLELIA